jgi:hypothetical protein
MGEFLRSRHGLDNELGFVQGPGLIVAAPKTTAWPDGTEDIMVLTAGATQFDLVSPWFYLGFTKTGINIVRNNAEDTFTVDQVEGAFKRRPNNWEMNVGTQLAEGTLETFAESWELPDPALVTKTAPQLNERHMGLGAPTAYRERRIAVLFQFESGLIRTFVFRKCTRAAQESGFTYQSGGEQVSLPTRWNAQTSDETGVTKDTRFGEVFEQVPAGP